MNITIKQLRKIIRETVEEAMGADAEAELREYLDTVSAVLFHKGADGVLRAGSGYKNDAEVSASPTVVDMLSRLIDINRKPGGGGINVIILRERFDEYMHSLRNGKPIADRLAFGQGPKSLRKDYRSATPRTRELTKWGPGDSVTWGGRRPY